MKINDKTIKIVIFDLDGVLVDACEWHRLALNEALKETVNYEIPIEEHYKNYNGLPTKVKLKKLEEGGLVSSQDFVKISNLKQKKTILMIEKHAKVRDEKVEMMEYLLRQGIRIGCYTNSIRKTAEMMLERTGVKQYMELILTNEDVSLSKPHPEGYLKCLEFFSASPEETLIIEDSPKGAAAAQASGCKLVKVKNQDEVNVELLRGLL